MKNAVVTGATSFIGIALIGELKKSGYNVTAVIRPKSNRSRLLRGLFTDVRIVECELGRMYENRDLFNLNMHGGSFFHIGWNSDFANARYNEEGQNKNVGFAIDALSTAINIRCNYFLAIGSQAECGLVSKPIDSFTEENPLNAYAEAKCETFSKCSRICDDAGIDFFWPRLLSAYGPYDRPETLIMSCIDACINHYEIDMTKGEQIWDFVYVEDVAKALRLIVEKGEAKKKYAIASGTGRPLAEYIEEISEVYEYPEILNGLGKRKYAENEVMYLVGDVKELEADTKMVFDRDFRRHIEEMKKNMTGRI